MGFAYYGVIMRTNREREFILDTLEDWKSGARGTVGCPSTGGRYPLIMREERKQLLARLREVDKQLGNELPEHVYSVER